MSSEQPENQDTLQRAQTQYERKLAIQQELAKMDHYASGVEDFLSEGYRSTSALFAPIDNISHSSRSSCSSHNSVGSIPPGFHAPPEGAVETARKFLWDEDDDDISLPPSRDFDGRVSSPADDGTETPPTPQASNSYKKEPGGLVRGVLSRLSKKYAPLEQTDLGCNTEMLAHADAASTISSNDDIDNPGGAIVTIDLGGPADTGNRQYKPESKSRCCNMCFSRVQNGCSRMCHTCCMCCRSLSRRQKALLLLVVLVGIALIVVSTAAPLNQAKNQEVHGGNHTNRTSVPTQAFTAFPSMAPVSAEPTVAATEQTAGPSLALNATVTPTLSPVPENQTSVPHDSPSPSPTAEDATSPTLTPTVETNPVTPLPSVVSSVLVTPSREGTAPFDTDRYEALHALIVESNLTTTERLKTLGTAQNKALLWLVDYDAYKIDPTDEFASLQRYALATIFFSTTFETGPYHHYNNVQQTLDALLTNPTPENWVRGENWMTPTSICQWEGVVCATHSSPERNKTIDTLRQGPSLANNETVIHFNLTDNGLAGGLPSEIAALRELKTLNLSNNSIYGLIPDSIGEMTNLAVLSLSGNELAENIPAEIGNILSLAHLSLEKNRLGGSIPKEISNLKELRVLRLQENRFSGTLPNLTGLDRLHTLLLDNNSFGGTVPKTYGSFSSLKNLNISSNELYGSVPSELSMLFNIEYLAMGHNKLYGALPDMFENMTALKELQLGKNDLDGSLPKTLGKLLSIRTLSFESNRFSGTIPMLYADLKSLNALYVFNNKLTGFIPSVMRGWELGLTDFRAHNNKLVGTIPPAFGSAAKIEFLQFEYNELSGTIPTSLGQLSQLQSFRIYNNRFSGTVPIEVCSLIKNDKLEFLAADCGRKGGTIQCDCCHECHPL